MAEIPMAIYVHNANNKNKADPLAALDKCYIFRILTIYIVETIVNKLASVLCVTYTTNLFSVKFFQKGISL